MYDPYFFGYGSLVNRSTHVYENARPARLKGWRRAWVGTPERGVVLLTGVPAEGHVIDGLIAEVPKGDWAALDRRESGYGRVHASDAVDHDLPHRPEIAVYAVHPDNMVSGGDPVILLSYLDVVVQGFHQVFGIEGVQRFFDTTDGWHTTILDDRADPIYPRHRQLLPAETRLVNDHLERLGTPVRPRTPEFIPPDF